MPVTAALRQCMGNMTHPRGGEGGTAASLMQGQARTPASFKANAEVSLNLHNIIRGRVCDKN